MVVADILYRDILGRGYILPKMFTEKTRHILCVWTYTALAAVFAIRGFVATGLTPFKYQVGAYYVLFSIAIVLHAIAIAKEKRGE